MSPNWKGTGCPLRPGPLMERKRSFPRTMSAALSRSAAGERVPAGDPAPVRSFLSLGDPSGRRGVLPPAVLQGSGLAWGAVRLPRCRGSGPIRTLGTQPPLWGPRWSSRWAMAPAAVETAWGGSGRHGPGGDLQPGEVISRAISSTVEGEH